MIKIKKYQIEDYISDATQDALDLKADLVNGKVPASQLPSFVDDVIEVANYAALPIPGETGVIYITLDTNKVFRWTGSVYVEIASGVTNLSYTPGVSDGTVNSDTGTDATIPLAGATNAGLFSAAEKTKLGGIATGANVGVVPNAPITGATKTKITYDAKGLVTAGTDATTADIADSTNKRYVTDANLVVIGNTSGTNTGDQDLQSVLDNGNSTTTPIGIDVDDGSYALSVTNEGNFGAFFQANGNGGGAAITSITTNSCKAADFYSNEDTVLALNQGLNGDGLIINSGTSSTGNFIELNKNGVDKLVVNQAGELTATKLIKQSGTSAQLLAANGDSITAGTNITISNGEISSVGGSGGSSVNFYLNGSIASGVAGYQQIGSTAVIGGGTDFTLAGNGTIAQFLTDAGSPNRLEIPAGAWTFELWLQSSVNNSTTNVYVELYKYNGTFTLIASNSSVPINLQTNTNTNLYITNLAIPQTTLLATDRFAVRVIAINSLGGHSVTLHTEDGNLCEILTNFVGGIVSINGLIQPTQTLAVGTTGTNFAINSSGSTHTFNLPDASATARGVVTTGTQTFAGAKTFSSISFGATGVPVFFEYVGNPFLNVGPGVTFSIGGGPGTAQNNLAVPNGTFNIGLQTASTIASFDANKNVVSLTAANGYPTLAELKWLSGVTSSIQTQFSGKQNTITLTTTGTSGAATLVGSTLNIPQYSGGSSAQSAFTILANNTASSAVPTEKVYKEVAQQSLSGTGMTATGGALPTGTNTHFYRWSQVGNLVTVRINLQFQTAATCSGIAIPFANLPDIPQVPQHPSIYNTAGDVITYGSGMLNVNKTLPVFSQAAGASGIRIKTLGTPNTYEFLVGRISSSYAFGWIQIQYYI